MKAKLHAQYGENKKIVDGAYDEALAVKCINGTFVGKKEDGIVTYKGIPFVAEQPVGKLRWKAPVAYVEDDGVYEAFYNGKSPYQLENVSEKGSLYVQGEDCLYLDIWKADDDSCEKKPVMVWIHGGAFEMGGTADPTYDCVEFVLENPDVIVVSIEYRLGIFGFGLEAYSAWAADRYAKKLAQLTEEEQALVESYCADAPDVTPEYTGVDRMFDQTIFIAPLFRLSENQTKAGGKSYTYFFTPESDIPLMRCGHAVELPVVFKHQDGEAGSAFDETFSRTLRKMWVQFAKTGNPSLAAEDSPGGTAKEWPLYDLENRQVMVFDEDNIHSEREREREILDWERTYFLTKYYCI